MQVLVALPVPAVALVVVLADALATVIRDAQDARVAVLAVARHIVLLTAKTDVIQDVAVGVLIVVGLDAEARATITVVRVVQVHVVELAQLKVVGVIDG